MNRPDVRDIDVKSVLTPSNLPVCDFSANPYGGCAHACRYCYASFMKRFTGHAEPWGSFVDVKHWPPLRRPERHAGKEVFIGSVTDPYQPLEETRRRTRALLEQLQGSGIAVSIATKSDLVLRDLDLLKTFPRVRVSFSVNTLDEDFRAAMDSAPSIARRLDAMAALHAAGIRTTCFVSPIFPGITDVPAIIDRARAHCNLVWLENLNLRGDYKARILAWIAAERPALVPLYDAIYRRGDRTHWAELDATHRTFCAARGLPYLRADDTLSRPFDAPPDVVNYFFHEQVKKSARRKTAASERTHTP